jgi:hypothetical protein
MTPPGFGHVSGAYDRNSRVVYLMKTGKCVKLSKVWAVISLWGSHELCRLRCVQVLGMVWVNPDSGDLRVILNQQSAAKGAGCEFREAKLFVVVKLRIPQSLSPFAVSAGYTFLPVDERRFVSTHRFRDLLREHSRVNVLT